MAIHRDDKKCDDNGHASKAESYEEHIKRLKEELSDLRRDSERLKKLMKIINNARDNVIHDDSFNGRPHRLNDFYNDVCEAIDDIELMEATDETKD